MESIILMVFALPFAIALLKALVAGEDYSEYFKSNKENF